MNAPDCSSLLGSHLVSITADDVVCFHCFRNDRLRKIVERSGTQAECTACGRIESTLPIAQIAAHMDEIIRTTFYGSFPRHEEDDQEAPAADLRCIVRELLDGPHACEDAIVEALIRNELIANDVGAFYSHTACYERRSD